VMLPGRRPGWARKDDGVSDLRAHGMDRGEIAEDVAAIRGGFAGAEYTTDGVSELLGHVAELALARRETVPARRVARADGTPLAALIRLFLLQDDVHEEELAGQSVDALDRLGLVETSPG